METKYLAVIVDEENEVIRLSLVVWPSSDEEDWECVLEKWQLAMELCQKFPHYTILLGGPRTCAFCNRYLIRGADPYEDECRGCPIAEAGFHHCSNAEHERWGTEFSYGAARDEYRFLLKLREHYG